MVARRSSHLNRGVNPRPVSRLGVVVWAVVGWSAHYATRWWAASSIVGRFVPGGGLPRGWLAARSASRRSPRGARANGPLRLLAATADGDALPSLTTIHGGRLRYHEPSRGRCLRIAVTRG